MDVFGVQVMLFWTAYHFVVLPFIESGVWSTPTPTAIIFESFTPSAAIFPGLNFTPTIPPPATVASSFAGSASSDDMFSTSLVFFLVLSLVVTTIVCLGGCWLALARSSPLEPATPNEQTFADGSVQTQVTGQDLDMQSLACSKAQETVSDLEKKRATLEADVSQSVAGILLTWIAQFLPEFSDEIKGQVERLALLSAPVELAQRMADEQLALISRALEVVSQDTLYLQALQGSLAPLRDEQEPDVALAKRQSLEASSSHGDEASQLEETAAAPVPREGKTRRGTRGGKKKQRLLLWQTAPEASGLLSESEVVVRLPPPS